MLVLLSAPPHSDIAQGSPDRPLSPRLHDGDGKLLCSPSRQTFFQTAYDLAGAPRGQSDRAPEHLFLRHGIIGT